MSDITELRRVITDEGTHPEYHRAVMAKHRHEWPVLWKALDAILADCAIPPSLDVDVLTGALSGMGVIDNGTWVSFNRADAERIAELYALHARLAATLTTTERAL